MTRVVVVHDETTIHLDLNILKLKDQHYLLRASHPIDTQTIIILAAHCTPNRSNLLNVAIMDPEVKTFQGWVPFMPLDEDTDS
ncbi:MAG: hypothetical protein GY737_26355 [Desulfobacteraceae bacterium]|nr:hypothetical protein [Desulfobacteraceae bacterium]